MSSGELSRNPSEADSTRRQEQYYPASYISGPQAVNGGDVASYGVSSTQGGYDIHQAVNGMTAGYDVSSGTNVSAVNQFSDPGYGYSTFSNAHKPPQMPSLLPWQVSEPIIDASQLPINGIMPWQYQSSSLNSSPGSVWSGVDAKTRRSSGTGSDWQLAAALAHGTPPMSRAMISNSRAALSGADQHLMETLQSLGSGSAMKREGSSVEGGARVPSFALKASASPERDWKPVFP